MRIAARTGCIALLGWMIGIGTLLGAARPQSALLPDVDETLQLGIANDASRGQAFDWTDKEPKLSKLKIGTTKATAKKKSSRSRAKTTRKSASTKARSGKIRKKKTAANGGY